MNTLLLSYGCFDKIWSEIWACFMWIWFVKGFSSHHEKMLACTKNKVREVPVFVLTNTLKCSTQDEVTNWMKMGSKHRVKISNKSVQSYFILLKFVSYISWWSGRFRNHTYGTRVSYTNCYCGCYVFPLVRQALGPQLRLDGKWAWSYYLLIICE